MTTYSCPRCQATVDENFYGPCATCRAALRAHYASAARDVAEQRFEPVMHVTPNAVATKD